MKAVLGWLHKNFWRDPIEIKGVAYTLTFYIYILLGLAVGSIVCQSPGGVWLLIAFSLVSMLLQYFNSKPKKLGRPLPYRRRRG